MSKLPPNTRIHASGHVEFRKQYKGNQVIRTWPIELKEKAFREIYDLLLRMSKNDDLIVETEHRMSIEEACDTYLQLHGPSLKGGVSMKCNAPYYNLSCRLNVIKEAWSGRFYDTVTTHDVRDLLKRFKTPSTALKYLGTLTHMYRSYTSWNEEENVLKAKVKLSAVNPAIRWRAQMKSSQKKELPRTRVLSPHEWNQFKIHMKPRTREICEIALKRFLRLADIRQISQMMIKGEIIEGLQQKTGEKFTIPVLAQQPTSYDFTNFDREFRTAQVQAGMDFPVEHPVHFTVRDLRRTGATWAYQKTKDLVGISKMLGHTKISTTIRYLNIDEADKHRIAQVVDEMADSDVVSQVNSNRVG
jgi:integrase